MRLNSNDYQTPTYVAKAMRMLADEYLADNVLDPGKLRWCEPTAGIGLIAEQMPENTDCYEVNDTYFEKHRAHHCRWYQQSFLDCTQTYDVFLANPPCSKNPTTGKTNALPFIEKMAECLADDGFILILIPAVQPHTKGLQTALKRCKLNINYEYKITGRDRFINPLTSKPDKQGAKQPSSIFRLSKHPNSYRGWKTCLINPESLGTLFPNLYMQ